MAIQAPHQSLGYCDSEANSACSTPFVSAPSSPARVGKAGNPSLYYYFSAPSSPPRHGENPQQQSAGLHQRGFSFTACEFQFQSRFDSPRASSARAAEDPDQILGFYFSAPTSPDRKSGGGGGSWGEMPGTPKMIFGGGDPPGGGGGVGGGAALMESPDFEFTSSRMSHSDSAAVSAHMSSADELFFKGQLVPLKLHPRANHHTWAGVAAALTSSDSSGSSQTMGSSCSSASAPPSPTGRKSGSVEQSTNKVCGSPKAASAAAGRGGRFLSPFQFLRKYQPFGLSGSSSRNSAGSSCESEVSSTAKKAKKKKLDSSSSSRSSSSSSSRGKTLRELLHLSSVRKKNKTAAAASPPPPPLTEAQAPPPQNDPPLPPSPPKKKAPPAGFDHHKRRLLERSLVGDYSRRFNQRSPSPASARGGGTAAGGRRRYHSGSILDLHYNYHAAAAAAASTAHSSKRFHSGAIVPESTILKSGPLGFEKKIPPHQAAHAKLFHSGPILDKADGSASSSIGSSGGGSRRFAPPLVGGGGGDSAPPSRSVSPRRAAMGRSPGELHYGTRAIAAEQEMRRRTSFLPYKQGLLGCLGCATMRIAGLSKSRWMDAHPTPKAPPRQ